MKRWTHLHTLATGAAGWSVVDHTAWSFLAVFALGLLTGACLVYARRALGRLGRVAGALERRIIGEPPFSDDPDYLDGVERGIRSARRSAGHEDGRLSESTRLLERPAP